MANIDSIRKKFGGPICRRCISEVYGVNLQQKDCFYESPYLSECPRCGEGRHLVSDFRASGKMKMMFKT